MDYIDFIHTHTQDIKDILMIFNFIRIKFVIFLMESIYTLVYSILKYINPLGHTGELSR